MKKTFNVKKMKLQNYQVLEICLSQFHCIINLISPEKHHGGFFSKSYITYLVTTSPCGFKVRRRYSDFEWLRSILLMIYPGFVVF